MPFQPVFWLAYELSGEPSIIGYPPGPGDGWHLNDLKPTVHVPSAI